VFFNKLCDKERLRNEGYSESYIVEFQKSIKGFKRYYDVVLGLGLSALILLNGSIYLNECAIKKGTPLKSDSDVKLISESERTKLNIPSNWVINVNRLSDDSINTSYCYCLGIDSFVVDLKND